MTMKASKIQSLILRFDPQGEIFQPPRNLQGLEFIGEMVSYIPI